MGTHIRGILTVVPANIRTTEDLAGLYGPSEAERTAKLTGVNEVHVVSPDETAADLAEEAGSRLLAKTNVSPGDVDGVIFATQTPDFLMPASACILQDRLRLSKQSLAFDVNLGCSAYAYGLAIASGMISAGLAKRILLLVGDALSLLVHRDDKSSRCLFGDAVTATMLEQDSDGHDLLGTDLGTDGSGWANLIIPIGQGRYRSLDEFAANPPEHLRDVPHPECFCMDGAEVFTFTLREVPGIIERTLQSAGRDVDSVDYFFFHQANKFIQDHLARKIGLPSEKCPVSIDRYGNTSGASPAVTACHAVAGVNRDRELLAMFVGFGVGYSWGGALVRLRPDTVFPIETV